MEILEKSSFFLIICEWLETLQFMMEFCHQLRNQINHDVFFIQHWNNHLERKRRLDIFLVLQIAYGKQGVVPYAYNGWTIILDKKKNKYGLWCEKSVFIYILSQPIHVYKINCNLLIQNISKRAFSPLTILWTLGLIVHTP